MRLAGCFASALPASARLSLHKSPERVRVLVRAVYRFKWTEKGNGVAVPVREFVFICQGAREVERASARGAALT